MTKCLIVDDSPTIRKLILRIVKEWKFDCQEAEDGQKAMHAGEEFHPDIIILDWNMPVMSGYDFLCQARTCDWGQASKIMFCTTENGFEFIQKGMSAGADEYIMKPFDRDILMSKLMGLGILSGQELH